MKSYTNIEDKTIEDFVEYTRECRNIIEIIKMPEMPKESYVNLPFTDKIGLGEGKKRLAIFDLDETLVHCEIENIYNAEAQIDVLLPGNRIQKIGLNIRPHWKEELKKLESKYYFIIYTASHQSYCDAVVNFLDPDKSIFIYRLYRNNCTQVDVQGQNFYVKDLRILKGINLKDVVIIDNSLLSFAFHVNNGIPIIPYYNGPEKGHEFSDLCVILDKIGNKEDLSVCIQKIFGIDNY